MLCSSQGLLYQWVIVPYLSWLFIAADHQCRMSTYFRKGHKTICSFKTIEKWGLTNFMYYCYTILSLS